MPMIVIAKSWLRVSGLVCNPASCPLQTFWYGTLVILSAYTVNDIAGLLSPGLLQSFSSHIPTYPRTNLSALKGECSAAPFHVLDRQLITRFIESIGTWNKHV
jgi:hypothetical protein